MVVVVNDDGCWPVAVVGDIVAVVVVDDGNVVDDDDDETSEDGANDVGSIMTSLIVVG